MRETFATRKHTILLVVAVAAEVLQPFATTHLGGLLYDFLVIGAVLCTFLVVFERRRQRMVGLFLGLPAIFSNWVHYIAPDSILVASEVVHHLFMCAFLAYAAVTILEGIFRQRTVQVDAVVGALCGYLLAGAAFGNLFTVIEQLNPGSFAINSGIAAELHNWHARRFLFGYFSLVTLTSMGYGDITPVSPAAASLTWMEAVFGQFYLAVVVAQLVGMRLVPRLAPAPPPATDDKP